MKIKYKEMSQENIDQHKCNRLMWDIQDLINKYSDYLDEYAWFAVDKEDGNGFLHHSEPKRTNKGNTPAMVCRDYILKPNIWDSDGGGKIYISKDNWPIKGMKWEDNPVEIRTMLIPINRSPQPP